MFDSGQCLAQTRETFRIESPSNDPYVAEKSREYLDNDWETLISISPR